MIRCVSLHVPKCAGSAIRSALVRTFGRHAVLIVTGESPDNPAHWANLDPDGYDEAARRDARPSLEGKVVVHGHFPIRKYDHLPPPCARVTFLRHPVDRTISHFRFWQRYPRHGNPLHDYMLDGSLDVIRFARLPIIRYFYTRTFFGGVERNRFDFVGCVERMERDLPRFEEVVGRTLEVRPENVGRGRRGQGLDDPETRAALAELLTDDIDLYREWCRPE